MNANPDWKSELPPPVAELIEKEQLIQELGIRGLASGDSREFSTAVEKLKGALAHANEAGYLLGCTEEHSRQWYTAYLFGAVGWLVATALAIFAIWQQLTL